MMDEIGHIGHNAIGRVYILPKDKIGPPILLATNALIAFGDSCTEASSVCEKFAHELEFIMKPHPIIPDMVQYDYAYSPIFRRKKKNTEKKSFWKQRMKNLQNKK